MECARCIERNPLRAGIIKSIDGYKWSSYLFYGMGKDDGIIRLVNPVYVQLSNDVFERREKYREYVFAERPYERIIDKGLRI